MVIEVPDSIFLNRWWEVAVRVVFFLLGISYSAIFGTIFTDDIYLAIPLLLVAFAILFGRAVAMKKKEAYEKKKIIAEIIEMELAQQRADAIREEVVMMERMRQELATKESLEKELALAKEAIQKLLEIRQPKKSLGSTK